VSKAVTNAILSKVLDKMNMEVSNKSRGVFILLALFLGGFGIHNFYAGHYGRGILQLICTCTLIGAPITLLWCILDIVFQKHDGLGRRMML
jgi:TM2 domain-containing membrane protein YozV